MADNTRTSHPYWMYEHMQAQPEAWRDVITRNRGAAMDFARAMQGAQRVFLVGIGTSYHAAQTGENILRTFGGTMEYRAVHSMDFALYGPRLNADDAVIVISHRGTKGYSVASLKRAREAGCRTAAIVGQGADIQEAQQFADAVFDTVPQEQSSAHTFSYTGSVAVLAALAQSIESSSTRGAALSSVRPDPGSVTVSARSLDDKFLLETVPHALRAALDTESSVTPLAGEYAKCRRIFVVGGGPATIVAHEIGLKIKETAYLQAEGLMTETMLHGHFQCAEAEDGFVLIAPQGAARSRTMEMGAMIGDIGARYFVVADIAPDDTGAEAWVRVPSVPEPFSTLTCLMPMQLFAYHCALAAERNPDNFRRDDPRFKQAMGRITL